MQFCDHDSGTIIMISDRQSDTSAIFWYVALHTMH